MEAVGGEAGFERPSREAAHVPGLAGAFQAVHHHQVAGGRPGGRLRFHQHLDPRRGAIEAPLQRKAPLQPAPPPQMPGDGLQVRMAKQRLKGIMNRRNLKV